MMKNLLKIFFIFIISFCFNNKVIACDLFNISPGSEISKLENIVGEIDLDYDIYNKHDVFRLIVSNDLYCPNSSLKRTSSSIFISNNRVTGIEIESYLKKSEVHEKQYNTEIFNLDLPLRDARENFEKAYLMYQLEKANGNVSKLANEIGIERTHLYRKLKTLGINLK